MAADMLYATAAGTWHQLKGLKIKAPAQSSLLRRLNIDIPSAACTWFPNTFAPRTFLLIVPSLFKISVRQREMFWEQKESNSHRHSTSRHSADATAHPALPAPNAATTRPWAGLPGRYAAWPSASASMRNAPICPRRWAMEVFPLPLPPVRPMM